MQFITLLARCQLCYIARFKTYLFSFIQYHSLRHELNILGLKFCLAQRDFIVGMSIVDNIIRCISLSRRTVFIISHQFIKSGWCMEELIIAHNVGHLRSSRFKILWR